jgi:hypothetical protein
MATIRHWDAKKSKINNTDYRTWNQEQMTEWLLEFERVPVQYATEVLKHVKNGKELASLSRVELHNLGVPWGIASHMSKAQDHLHQGVHGIFAPTFVEESQPYAWPYNGNIT